MLAVLKSSQRQTVILLPLAGNLWAHIIFSVAFAAIDSVRKSRKPLGEQIEERLREKDLL